MIVLTNKRMAIAKRLLNHTEMPIAEIALSVGYAENASFSRAFKAWSGQTPETFRSRRI
jgi:AraC-like DNA-binding protein